MMDELQASLDLTRAHYEEVVYPCASYPLTEISRLAGIGRLFALDVTDVRTSRVLELGCGDGTNLLPMACRYPAASFVGIDIAPSSISAAHRMERRLGVSNVRFIEASITDLPAELGSFDYIIVHGVYSWVPTAVQEAILAIISVRLTPVGIGYVSYNTLPGWNMVRTARDMMKYHADGFSRPDQKIEQARAFLNLVRHSMREQDPAYAAVLDREADALADANPSYVFHEHLEHYNDPVYFHEFVSRAQTMGLRYLGDADLPSMHVGNCPPKAAAKLREIDDIVRQEQYIDFLTNRRFRSTLLCRETQLPDRTLSPEALCSLCYATSVRPRSGWASPPRSGQPLVLDDPRTGRTFTIRDRVIAAFIEALATPVASRLKPLTLTLKQLAREIDLDADGRLAIVSRLGEMIFTGLIQVASTPSTAPPKLSPRPKSWACSRIYAEHRDVIPNLEHRNVHVPPQWRLLLTILDGSLTADEAVHRFAADSGEHGSPRRRQEEAWETLHALLTLSLLES